MLLGIKLGSPGETLKNKLETQLKSERGAGFKDVKTYDDHPAAYLALAQGSVDGVLNTVPTLAVVLRDKPGAFAMVQNVGGNNWHGYAFRKEDTEIADFMNGRITTMKGNGELAALHEQIGIQHVTGVVTAAEAKLVATKHLTQRVSEF